MESRREPERKTGEAGLRGGELMRVGHAQHGRAARKRAIANRQEARELCSRAFAKRRSLIGLLRSSRPSYLAADRSGKHALERRAIRRLTVRRQHELDGQIEQRAESF